MGSSFLGFHIYTSAVPSRGGSEAEQLEVVLFDTT